MKMGPPGTVCCFMCKGMIIYKKGDKSRFINHMNNEHGVVFELDFLFATCKLNENERIKVKDVIENELMIDKPEGQEFNEETVKKQLRKIIPVFNSKEMENVYGDDDIEVIKAVTAAEKSVTKDAELEQISRKRRLSGSSTASSGVSVNLILKSRVQPEQACRMMVRKNLKCLLHILPLVLLFHKHPKRLPVWSLQGLHQEKKTSLPQVLHLVIKVMYFKLQ